MAWTDTCKIEACNEVMRRQALLPIEERFNVPLAVARERNIDPHLLYEWTYWRGPARNHKADRTIYFLQAETGPIKIGITIGTIERRLAQIQANSPVKLTLLGTVSAQPSLEKELHRRFERHRIHGEWFHPKRELKDFIGGICCGD